MIALSPLKYLFQIGFFAILLMSCTGNYGDFGNADDESTDGSSNCLKITGTDQCCPRTNIICDGDLERGAGHCICNAKAPSAAGLDFDIQKPIDKNALPHFTSPFPAAATFEVYTFTNVGLYRIDPKNFNVTRVGTFSFPSGQDYILSVTFGADGLLYGSGGHAFYQIDKQTARTKLLYRFVQKHGTYGYADYMQPYFAYQDPGAPAGTKIYAGNPQGFFFALDTTNPNFNTKVGKPNIQENTYRQFTRPLPNDATFLELVQRPDMPGIPLGRCDNASFGAPSSVPQAGTCIPKLVGYMKHPELNTVDGLTFFNDKLYMIDANKSLMFEVDPNTAAAKPVKQLPINAGLDKVYWDFAVFARWSSGTYAM